MELVACSSKSGLVEWFLEMYWHTAERRFRMARRRNFRLGEDSIVWSSSGSAMETLK